MMRNQKLSIKYLGPFKIVSKIGIVAYNPELPLTTRIHLVFHVPQVSWLNELMPWKFTCHYT